MSYCIIYAKYEEDDESRNYLPPWAQRQPGKWTKRERKKFGKILFLKIPFFNSLYLWTGTLCYHHTKMKLKFKKMNRYAVGPKIELKLICHKKTPSLENMDTSLLSAYCATSSCPVRFKVKEYKQIRYVLWAATGYGQMVKGTKQRKCETYGIFKSFFNLRVLLLYSKYSKRTLKLKKDLKVPYVSHFICVLIIIYTLHAKLF